MLLRPSSSVPHQDLGGARSLATPRKILAPESSEVVSRESGDGATSSAELPDGEPLGRSIEFQAPGSKPVETGSVTFAQHVAGSHELWLLRVSSTLILTLGLFATMVAVVGIYGSMSYAVARRTREFGIRVAIGASPAGVRRMVIGGGLAFGGGGDTLGLVFGVGLERLMDSLFVDVGAFDVATFVIAASPAWREPRRGVAAGAQGDHREFSATNAAVTALLDRLLHHAHVLKCGPRSWRPKAQADLRHAQA